MSKNNKEIIDIRYGDITADDKVDKVTLYGVYPFENHMFIENLEVKFNENDNKIISINIPYSGYYMQLFIADFLGTGKDQIMVRGGLGGSGAIEIAIIYKYENGNLIPIFNQDTFFSKNSCIASFEDNYIVRVNCNNKEFIIDLASKEKVYLNLIYTDDGKLKTKFIPYIDAPTTILPIKQSYSNHYDLIIQQRIVGINNNDNLGAIQTYVSFKDDEMLINHKVLITFGNNYDYLKLD